MLRWLISDKALAQALANMMSCGGVEAYKVENFAAVRHGAEVRWNFQAEHALLIGIVPWLRVQKFAGFRQFETFADILPAAIGPTGKGAGRFIDIFINKALRLALNSTRHFAPLVIERMQIGIGAQSMQFK